jgi:hypothetical protein
VDQLLRQIDVTGDRHCENFRIKGATLRKQVSAKSSSFKLRRGQILTVDFRHAADPTV